MLIKSDKKRTNNLLHSKGKAHYLTKRQKGRGDIVSPRPFNMTCQKPSLHAAESFPAHIPCTVGRKSRITYRLATVPTGTHHCHGIKQTAVAG